MPATADPHVRIVSPASRESQPLSDERLREFAAAQITVSYHKLDPYPSWPFVAGSVQARLEQLLAAVQGPAITAVLAARGGYGSSDLLELLPWKALRQLPPKPLVGFSDISALHSAFYTKLGWSGIHGPMPGTELWGQHGRDDVSKLLALLRGEQPTISLPLLYLGRGLPPVVRGWGFGGCLSVLTNLIGTPFFPNNLSGSLLFWEDIAEHPARILRFANQWQQSGALAGVKGLVLGRFAQCELAGICTESQLHEELSQRLNLPVWFSPYFGHCSPNWPLPIGRTLRIDGESLSWDWDTKHG